MMVVAAAPVSVMERCMNSDILIVDDDPDAREILDLVLRTLEIPLRQATDGDEALTLAFDLPPLLIVLDLSMPRMDGAAVLRGLRARPETADIPVVVFTAQVINDELADQLRLPPPQIVRKGSLSMTRLRELILRLIKGKIELKPEVVSLLGEFSQ